MSSSNSLNYRADIDGLRAVAVTLVLLFHAGLGLPGGYIGVDVFFVISGYLITTLVLKQQQAKTFRLSVFWARRIRRIVPASVCVVVATLVAGALILFSSDFDELAKSAIAQQLMVANLFFWRETGYFAGPADLKPLLHMWSLAIEEQFYVAYPFVLLVIHRKTPRTAFSILFIATVASLAISEWAVRNYGGAAFFLLPSRAWELLLGGMICLLPVAEKCKHANSSTIGGVGMSMIFYAAIAFDSVTPFPGLAALVPCLGAAFTIYSSTQQPSLVGKILSHRFIVFIGLISYSLYLWHWPIFAFLRYLSNEPLPVYLRLLALAATFIIACFSYWFVETPFRKIKSPQNQKRTLIALVGTVPIITVICVVVACNSGFPGRYPEAERFRSARESKAFLNEVNTEQVRLGNVPEFGVNSGPQTCLVWGDSHAMALMPGIDAASNTMRVFGYQLTHSSTPPIRDFGSSAFRGGLKSSVPEYNAAVLEFAQTHKVDAVIVSGFWSNYVKDSAFENQLRKTVERLNDSGFAVAIVLDVATFPTDVPMTLALRSRAGKATNDFRVSPGNYLKTNGTCNDIIRRVAEGRATVLDPAPYLVDASGAWLSHVEGEVLYRDNQHLSIIGGRRLKPLFESLFQLIAKPKQQ